MTAPPSLDSRAIRCQRLLLGGLLLVAFVCAEIRLAGAVAAAMFLFALLPFRFSPLYQFCHRLRKPAPEPTCDCGPAENHFACALGAVFILAGLGLHRSGHPHLGWGIVLLVATLIMIAGTTGFCLGNLVYAWLREKLR